MDPGQEDSQLTQQNRLEESTAVLIKISLKNVSTRAESFVAKNSVRDTRACTTRMTWPQDSQTRRRLGSHELQVNENGSNSESNKHAWAHSQGNFLDWTFIRDLNFNQLELLLFQVPPYSFLPFEMKYLP